MYNETIRIIVEKFTVSMDNKTVDKLGESEIYL